MKTLLNILLGLAAVFVSACSSVPVNAGTSESRAALNPRLVYDLGQDIKSGTVSTLAPFDLNGWKVQAIKFDLVGASWDGDTQFYRILATKGSVQAKLVWRRIMNGKEILNPFPHPTAMNLGGWTGTCRFRIQPENVEVIYDIDDVERDIPKEARELMGNLAHVLLQSKVVSEESV